VAVFAAAHPLAPVGQRGGEIVGGWRDGHG
jgi:hypothetical protein